MKINAKDELLNHIGNKEVICAKVIKGDEGYYIPLYPLYNKDDYDLFLNYLNFEYDNNTDFLKGMILYKDGFSVRSNYCGFNYWSMSVTPTPKEVMEYFS